MKKLVAVFVVLFSTSPGANAISLEGANASMVIRCCTTAVDSRGEAYSGDVLVGPGIEFPDGFIKPGAGGELVGANIDIGSSTITIDFTGYETIPFVNYDFYFGGPTVVPTVVDSHLNSLSSFSAAIFRMNNYSDRFQVLIGGLSATPTSRIVIDVDVAVVPEPEIYAMLLAGLGLVGFMGGRRHYKPHGKTHAVCTQNFWVQMPWVHVWVHRNCELP